MAAEIEQMSQPQIIGRSLTRRLNLNGGGADFGEGTGEWKHQRMPIHRAALTSARRVADAMGFDVCVGRDLLPHLNRPLRLEYSWMSREFACKQGLWQNDIDVLSMGCVGPDGLRGTRPHPICLSCGESRRSQVEHSAK